MYIDEVTKKVQDSSIHFCFIGYRDHGKGNKGNWNNVVKCCNFTDGDTLHKFITDNITADGGGDTPEAVIDGIHVANSKNVKWRKDSVKYIVHVADAPPHGK